MNNPSERPLILYHGGCVDGFTAAWVAWRKFDLPQSRAISAAIRSYAFDFQVWSTWATHGACPPDYMFHEGRPILRYQQKHIDIAVKRAVLHDICGHQVPCVNDTTDMISEIAGALAVGHPFGACYFVRAEDGKVVFSLRSTKDGIDVSEVAKSMGGGGHPRAAGFERLVSEMRW